MPEALIGAIKNVDYSYSHLVEDDISDREFVTGLYREVLGREPDPEGLDLKVSYLAEGVRDRRTTVMDFLVSEEHEKRMTAACPNFSLQFDPS